MFKKLLIMSLALLSGSHLWSAHKGLEVSNVEPPYWWTGMKNDTLQIMLTGPQIGLAEASITYPGVKIAEQLTLDSPNYKFLYLILGPDTKPGNMAINLVLGKRKTVVNYELKKRDRKSGDYLGFDAGDVLYLLMPDRFARGDMDASKEFDGLDNKVAYDRSKPGTRHGGNIEGIKGRLPYLDSLGVTAIWLTPVLENDMPGGSYHGYATTDYYRIDPRFGTNQQWADFIAEAQKRGMKVVMDMIFNHTGSEHPWMKDMPSNDWYNHTDGKTLTNFRLTTVPDPYASDYDRDHTVNGWFVPEMPDLNQRNPHLMRYLLQNSIWWVESSKINGIRMDTYPYADMNGMAFWAKEVLREYPNFNIVGECWYDNEAGPAFWQSKNRINPVDTYLPTVMDFKFILDGHKYFDEITGPWGGGLNGLYGHLSLDYLYADPQRILTFLDNHDTDRWLLDEPESLDTWKQAQAFLLTSRGIPQIYYGTEILMNGTKKKNDGDIRLDMPGGFPGDKNDAFTSEGRSTSQNEAWDYLSKILNWRRSHPVNEIIAQGTLRHFIPADGMYVYERRLGSKQIVVLLNGTDEETETDMSRYAEILPVGAEYSDIIGQEPIEINSTMTFSPRQVMILQNF